MTRTPFPAAKLPGGEGVSVYAPWLARHLSGDAVPYIAPHWIADAMRDEDAAQALAEMVANQPPLRPSRHRVIEPEPLMPWYLKVMVGCVWVVCTTYCVAIWCGWAA